MAHEETIAQVEKVDKPIDPKEKKKKRIKYILNISLVLIVTVVALVITLADNYKTIISLILSCDPLWLLATFGVMLAVVLVRSFIYFCFARLYTKKYKFHQAMAVDQIGVFYNAVTPGASGGQVMQAYTYSKQGIPISSAVSMLAMHSIMYQIVLIIFGIISFVVKYDIINAIGNVNIGKIGDWVIVLPMWALTIIGFILNISVIGIVFLLGYWKGFHNFVMGPMMRFLAKIRLVKDPDKKRENLRIQVENFKIELRRLFSNIPFMLLVAVFFAVYIILKYSIPFFVGKALGNESTCASWFDSVLWGNYHQMITGLIPIPGSAGVSELAFRLLFVSKNATAANSFYFKFGTEQQFLDRLQYWVDNTPSSVASQQWFQDLLIAINNAGGSLDGVDKGSTVYITAYFKAIDSVNQTNSNSMANAALVVWRSITFIFPIIAAGLVTAFYRAAPKAEAEAGLAERGTMIALQEETMVVRQEELASLLETTQINREKILSKLRSDKKKPKEKDSLTHIEVDDEDDSI